MYVLVNWVQSEQGYSPDLPEGCGFLCLAGSPSYAGFGLFHVACPPDPEHAFLLAHAAPVTLAGLLESASRYPPALAGAVHSLELLRLSDRAAFVAELERLLRDRLDGQPSAEHVLVRSRTSECGYRGEGEYVWVVGYRPKAVGREVTWIAGDYHVYSDGVESFEVEPGWLAERFRSM